MSIRDIKAWCMHIEILIYFVVHVNTLYSTHYSAVWIRRLDGASFFSIGNVKYKELEDLGATHPSF